MTVDPPFVLDSNIFIEAARRYYAFDLVPEFWDGLIWHARAGRICSIDKVRDELKRGNDQLARWATGAFNDAFVSTADESVINTYRRVIQWAEDQGRFSRQAKNAFARGADAWLLAFAIAQGCTLVTHERPAPNRRSSIKIPDVCTPFGLNYINTFTMLRRLGGLGEGTSTAG